MDNRHFVPNFGFSQPQSEEGQQQLEEESPVTPPCSSPARSVSSVSPTLSPVPSQYVDHVEEVSFEDGSSSSPSVSSTTSTTSSSTSTSTTSTSSSSTSSSTTSTSSSSASSQESILPETSLETAQVDDSSQITVAAEVDSEDSIGSEDDDDNRVDDDKSLNKTIVETSLYDDDGSEETIADSAVEQENTSVVDLREEVPKEGEETELLEKASSDDEGVVDPLPTKPKSAKRCKRKEKLREEDEVEEPEAKKRKGASTGAEKKPKSTLSETAVRILKESARRFHGNAAPVRETSGIVQVDFIKFVEKKVLGQVMRPVDSRKVEILRRLLESKKLDAFLNELWTVMIPAPEPSADEAVNWKRLVVEAEVVALIEGNHRFCSVLKASASARTLLNGKKINLRVVSLDKESWSIVERDARPLSADPNPEDFFFHKSKEARVVVRGLEPCHSNQQKSADLGKFKNVDKFDVVADRVRSILGDHERRLFYANSRDEADEVFRWLKDEDELEEGTPQIPLGKLAFSCKTIDKELLMLISKNVLCNGRKYPWLWTDIAYLSFNHVDDLRRLITDFLALHEEKETIQPKDAVPLYSGIVNLREENKKKDKPEEQQQRNAVAAKRMQGVRVTTVQRRTPVQSLGVVKLDDNLVVGSENYYRCSIDLLEENMDTLKNFYANSKGVLLMIPITENFAPSLEIARRLSVTFSYFGRLTTKDDFYTMALSITDKELLAVRPRNLDVYDLEI